MKLYVVSGLGADFKVLEKLQFPEGLQVVFLNWLMPKNREKFRDYVQRMAARIDDSEPFALLGYSFGGVVVQELDSIKPARKVVILGSIKSDTEKSGFLKAGAITKIPKYLPVSLFGEKSAIAYTILRKIIDPKNPRLLEYFTVRDPYYLKWSIEKISGWKHAESKKVIQILADRDIVFPPKYSQPDYVIKNATHLFPVTRAKEVSKILADIFKS